MYECGRCIARGQICAVRNVRVFLDVKSKDERREAFGDLPARPRKHFLLCVIWYDMRTATPRARQITVRI